ncbi:hypothetical protein PBY51_018448 [Eleginops maclovinus]|uniref:Uncharacterized protein n=1 Tax=Eleginops maclovinus TaxID=56733 RepID=A0AAN7Y7F4_ELEMC|nr:hypothetical protein PBY51_018448 [Eleginops maclovinus]
MLSGRWRCCWEPLRRGVPRGGGDTGHRGPEQRGWPDREQQQHRGAPGISSRSTGNRGHITGVQRLLLRDFRDFSPASPALFVG